MIRAQYPLAKRPRSTQNVEKARRSLAQSVARHGAVAVGAAGGAVAGTAVGAALLLGQSLRATPSLDQKGDGTVVGVGAAPLVRAMQLSLLLTAVTCVAPQTFDFVRSHDAHPIGAQMRAAGVPEGVPTTLATCMLGWAAGATALGAAAGATVGGVAGARKARAWLGEE